MRSAMWLLVLVGLLAPTLASAVVGDTPPEPKPPPGYHQELLLEVKCGDGPGTLSVLEAGEGQLPLGPTRVFEDTQGRLYIYDFNTALLKTFSRSDKQATWTAGCLEGVVEDGPGVLIVDKLGNAYFYCGKSQRDGLSPSDETTLRKTNRAGDVIYEVGLWNPEFEPPGHAVVVYRGGRSKGISCVVPLGDVAPQGLNVADIRPETGVMITEGEFSVDAAGGFIFPIEWRTAKGTDRHVAVSYVRVGPSGESIERVPGHACDGKGRYYVGLNDPSKDKLSDSGSVRREVTIVDRNGARVSTRVITLAAEPKPGSAGTRGVTGRWHADDAGWLYCVRDLRLDHEDTVLDSGVRINGEYVIDVFDQDGQHVGTGRIPAPGFDVPFEPTVDRDGNIYFLHFRDRDIQVIKWEKISK